MDTLRLMTWNVENLYTPGLAGAPSEAVYADKLAFLAGLLAEEQPDVVALQEIGDPVAFTDLAARAGPAYAHLQLSTRPDRRGIRVGFLSRLPLTEVQEPREFDLARFPAVPVPAAPDAPDEAQRTGMSRGALAATVQVGGRRIRLLTAHLKSKLLSYPRAGGTTAFAPRDERERCFAAYSATAVRNTEAATLRDLVADTLLQRPADGVVLLGDLNDGPAAASTQILLGPEDLDASRPDRDDAVRLYNLVEPLPGPDGTRGDLHLVPPERRFSRRYHGRGELIDHILASRNLLGPWRDGALAGIERVDVRIDVITGEDAGPGPAARLRRARPDHAPVVVVLRID